MILRDKNECLACGFIEPPMPADGEKTDIGHQNLNCGDSMNLNQPQSILPNLSELHNRSVKFIITKDNKVTWKKRKGFKGSIWDLKYKEHSIEKGTNYLVVHYDKRTMTDENGLRRLDEEIVSELVEIAKQVSKEANFEINPTPIFHRIEVKTSYTMNKFTEPEAQVVYNTPYNNLEFKGKNAIPNNLNLTETLEGVRQAMLLEIKNKQLHQAVLEDMRDTLKEMRPKKANPILAPLESLLKTTIQLRDEINEKL
jgi:hypothetical protein